MNAPIIIYAALYLSRFYIIAASNDVDRNRCAECRKWLDNVIVLETVEDSNISVSEPRIVMFSGLTVGRSSSVRYENGVTIRENSRGMNFKTTVTLSWAAEDTLKCPDCGHVWKYRYRKSKTVPGPIHFSDSTKSTKSWRAEEITNERIINKDTNEVL